MQEKIRHTPFQLVVGLEDVSRFFETLWNKISFSEKLFLSENVVVFFL